MSLTQGASIDVAMRKPDNLRTLNIPLASLRIPLRLGGALGWCAWVVPGSF